VFLDTDSLIARRNLKHRPSRPGHALKLAPLLVGDPGHRDGQPFARERALEGVGDLDVAPALDPLHEPARVALRSRRVESRLEAVARGDVPPSAAEDLWVEKSHSRERQRVVDLYSRHTSSRPNKSAASHGVLAQDSFCHEPKLVAALATQHAAAVLGEVGVLLHGHAVPALVLHAADKHEDGHQGLERRTQRLVASEEEGDVQAQTVGEEGLGGVGVSLHSFSKCFQSQTPWSESRQTSPRTPRGLP
jgi:hypothetical protein